MEKRKKERKKLPLFVWICIASGLLILGNSYQLYLLNKTIVLIELDVDKIYSQVFHHYDQS